MSVVVGQKVMLGQREGPDVELVVDGDELYARYETPQGYSVVYDEQRGMFCYALLVDGAFVSTGVALDREPPTGAVLRGRESDAVRVVMREAARARRFPSKQDEPGGNR